MKLGKCIKELERIYNIKQGGSGYYGNQYKESRNNFATPKTESDLAKEIGVDVRTLQNYKKLTGLVPELQDLVETGILATIHTTKNEDAETSPSLNWHLKNPSVWFIIILETIKGY